MALHLNLLHEEIQEHRERQRDPLKIGLLALVVFGGLLAAYYMWNGYQVFEIKSQLAAVQRDWSKIEPKVTLAQKRAADLTATINTTKVLDEMIEGRFYWGPFLARITQCMAPNLQLTGLDGTVTEETRGVIVGLEGLAAGNEPRAAAEELRQLLIEQLGKTYSEVKVEFKTLEDLETSVKLGGASMTTARFALTINFNAAAPGTIKPAVVEAPTRRKR